MRVLLGILTLGTVLATGAPSAAQQPPSAQPQQPPFETRKVTDNVYIFRHMGHQSMFVVTSDGVIATDPINHHAAAIYLQEIKKITTAPVRYVVYITTTSITSPAALPSRRPEPSSSRIAARRSACKPSRTLAW